MKIIHWETISPDMRNVMIGFCQSELGPRFYLAGGTGLALQLGQMKLDALLGRASRKDFHDLYAICQHIPLRELLDSAPQKYPNVRDFEAQTVRRLAYFEHAEQEEPVPLLQDVPWETVKSYFRAQAISLGKDWLE